MTRRERELLAAIIGRDDAARQERAERRDRAARDRHARQVARDRASVADGYALRGAR